MYPRTNYEMTEEDLNRLLDSCKPTSVMFLSGGRALGSSLQEKANRAWCELGKRMGFDFETVRPNVEKGQRFFSAVPSETELQKETRIKLESEKKKQDEIKKITNDIERLQKRLKEIVV